MNNNVIIRKATISDTNSLEKLLYGFYVTQKKELSFKTQELEAYKNNDTVIQETVKAYIEDQKYLVYISFVDEIPAGFICGEIQFKHHKIMEKRGYVQDWFVFPEYRDKKIGKALFERLIQDFKSAGCHLITLDTFAEDKVAVSRYRHMGFRDRLLSFTKEI